MFSGWGLYCTDPAQHMATASEDVDYPDRDLFDRFDVHSFLHFCVGFG